MVKSYILKFTGYEYGEKIEEEYHCNSLAQTVSFVEVKH